MKKDTIRDLWEIIDTLNVYEKGLHNIKEYINDYISDIRHTKSKITDVILKMEMEEKR